MSDNTATSRDINIARTVQDACMRAAKEEFHNASMSGLCAEGAMEAAIGAIQSLDTEKLVVQAKQKKK